MKPWAVLGATSMLGREIVRQLRIKGVPTIAVGRSRNSDVVLDLGSGNKPLFNAVLADAAVLVHCASSFCGDDRDGVRTNFCVNATGAVDVLDLASMMNCRRIIYAGSLSSDPSLEPEKTLNAYGMSKLECERILEWGMKNVGGSFCSLRLTQLWDTEGACCVHQPWLGRIIAYTSRGLLLKMPHAHGPRNFLHIADAARLLIAAGEGDISGTHPVAYNNDTDMFDLAIKACSVFDRGGQVIFDPTKQPFRKINFPHDVGIFGKLGIQPEIDILHMPAMVRDAETAGNFGPLDVQ